MPDPEVPADGPPPHQWHSDSPQEQPAQDLVKGVPRLVQEARLNLGAGATPEAVFDDLKARGLEVTLDEVRADFAR